MKFARFSKISRRQALRVGIVFVVLAAAGALLYLHAERFDSPVPGRTVIPAPGVTLPLDTLEGRPLVNVTINGSEPYAFIFDTGASVSVIDSGLATELGLNSAGSVFTGGAVKVNELRFGNALLSGVWLQRMPLTQMFRTDLKPRGVLSALAFPGYLVTIDYPRKKLSVAQGELPVAGNGHTFQYGEVDELPTVTLEIASERIKTHVDAGSSAGITLPMRYKEVLALASELTPGKPMRTQAGESPVLKARLKEPVKLGDLTLDVEEVKFADLDPGDHIARGNIGGQVLQNYTLTLDSKNRRLRLEQ